MSCVCTHVCMYVCSMYVCICMYVVHIHEASHVHTCNTMVDITVQSCTYILYMYVVHYIMYHRVHIVKYHTCMYMYTMYVLHVYMYIYIHTRVHIYTTHAVCHFFVIEYCFFYDEEMTKGPIWDLLKLIYFNFERKKI